MPMGEKRQCNLCKEVEGNPIDLVLTDGKPERKLASLYLP